MKLVKANLVFKGANPKVKKGYSHKIWCIALSRRSGGKKGEYFVSVKWGPIGSVKEKNAKIFKSESKATAYIDKKIKQKLYRGYQMKGAA